MAQTLKSARRSVKFQTETWKGEDFSSSNPYRPAGPLHKGDLFINRDKEVQQVIQAVQRNQSVSIYGERRIGKTSLLFHLKDELENRFPKAKAEYFTFELIPSADDFYRRLADMLNIKKWETYVDFERILQGNPRILLLDEFDRATRDPDFTPDFFSVLRGWDVQDWLHLVVSTQFPLSDYAGTGSVTSPFGNTFLVLQLGNLNEANARELLQPVLNQVGKNWRTDWEKRVFEETHLHPWRLQVFGYTAWRLLEDGEVDFQTALETYRHDLDQMLTVQDTTRKRVNTKFAPGVSSHQKFLTNKESTSQAEDDQQSGLVSVPFIAILVALGAMLGVAGGMVQNNVLIIVGIGFVFLGLIGSLLRK